MPASRTRKLSAREHRELESAICPAVFFFWVEGLEICLARRPMSTKLSKRPPSSPSGLPQVGQGLMGGFEDETERGEKEEVVEKEEEVEEEKNMAGIN